VKGTKDISVKYNGDDENKKRGFCKVFQNHWRVLKKKM
jgi:hypothetical protein